MAKMYGPVLLVVGGVALWLLSQRKAPPPPGEGGKVLVKGSLGVASVAQAAAMGTHLAPKTPGEVAMVSVPWLGQSTNASGAAITWPYRVLIRIGHNTTLGWKRIDELFPGLTGQWYSPSVDGVSLIGPRTDSKAFIMPDDPNQQWDVRVNLEGKVSDAAGNPTALWQTLSTGEHVQALVTKAAAALVKGALGTISVSQRRVGRMGL